jgi:thioredoxin reductase
MIDKYNLISQLIKRDPFFKNKNVVVAGGGNSAAEAVIDLSAWAHHITVVHRSQWRADSKNSRSDPSNENILALQTAKQRKNPNL